jgi:hypothetical protein
MKASVLLVGIAGLLLAACGRTPEQRAIVANAELLADTLDAGADNVEDQADATCDPAARNGLEAAAENLHDDADNVRDAADAAADNS